MSVKTSDAARAFRLAAEKEQDQNGRADNCGDDRDHLQKRRHA
jgi:hypothetical protein